MENFKPTYLYIKQHSITGKLYFGKTTRTDVEKYLGSGNHWRAHYNYHGREHIVTLWYCIFYDKEECNKFALMFSEQHNIVESTEWANLIIETGLDKYQDGGCGYKHSEETKRKIGSGNKGKVHTPEQIENHRQKMTGRTRTDEAKLNTSESLKRAYATGKKVVSENSKNAMRTCNIGRKQSNEVIQNRTNKIRGKVRTEETKQRMRKPKEKVSCPRCNLVGAVGLMKRYHFDNCTKLA